MFSQTFPLRAAVIIIGICGVLAATPHLQAEELKAPPLIDVLIVPETSPLYPGMYCVASYSILHQTISQEEDIPLIAVEDAASRGVHLLEFLAPMALELEQLTAEEFKAEVVVLRNYLYMYSDASTWLDKVVEYDCRGMTNQWALVTQSQGVPL